LLSIPKTENIETLAMGVITLTRNNGKRTDIRDSLAFHFFYNLHL